MRAGDESQNDGRDHTQGPFTAHHQLGQVVSCGILEHIGTGHDDLAGRQYYFRFST